MDKKTETVTTTLKNDGKTVGTVTAPVGLFVPFGVLNRPHSAPKEPTR